MAKINLVRCPVCNGIGIVETPSGKGIKCWGCASESDEVVGPGQASELTRAILRAAQDLSR